MVRRGREAGLDKWQKRALARKKARQRELRRKMAAAAMLLMIGILAAVFAAVRISRNRGSADSSAVRTLSTADAADNHPGGVSAENAGSTGLSASDSAAQPSAGLSSASAAGTASSGNDSVIAAESAVQESSVQETIPDRSGFAVDPAKTDWNYADPDVKTIYLTFDDGPSSNTQNILDILDRYGVKATFFVTAENPEYQDYMKTEFDKGHTVGLHTYSHDYEAVYASADAYFSDLQKIGDIVKSEIGFVPCFIRFPGGSSNEISKKYSAGIMTELAKDVQDNGYQYWDWNASSGDGADETAEQTVANATSYASQNIVLLMHDSANKDTTVAALPQVIEYYKNQGYTFRALDRTSTVVHHTIFN